MVLISTIILVIFYTPSSYSQIVNDGGTCGDGVADAGIGESCDGDDLAGQTCESLGYGGGFLGCFGDCTYDTSGCLTGATCGNGVVEAGESCDGTDFGGQTCGTYGFSSGSLSCSGDCQTISTASCIS